MELKKFTQIGNFSLLLLTPLSVLFIILFFTKGLESKSDFYVYGFLAITFLLCLATFYKLSIFVNHKTVSFKLGLGLISKTYQLSNIKSCKAVSNSLISGIGIRLLSNGWMYNVSGFKAIELEFVNKKSIVRIGTDQPEKISTLIQSLLEKEGSKHSGTSFHSI